MKLESKWIEMFAEVFALCGVKAGDACAVLSETSTRPELPQLSELALARLGARPFHLTLPGRRLTAPVPVRSTGASDAIGELEPVVQALAASVFVADCTVEGLQHAVELPRTDLRIALAGARVGGVWGFTAKPGTLSHWPGGLVLAFPATGSVNGRLVMDRGDVNLTFKRYLQERVTLVIEDDRALLVEGDHVDGELMRGYLEAWGDADAYAVSHVGWGLNRRAHWGSMQFYDKADFNGTELRAFAGNFLYSTGANEVAGRHTLGHFDLPLRGCTITLDGETVVDAGRLV
jgi:2,5-dihydroxypyridine 5,6-dioxygenase